MNKVYIVYRDESEETSGGGCAFWDIVMAICETREDAEKCIKTFKQRNKKGNWGLSDFGLSIKECEMNKLFYDIIEED